MRHVLRVLAGKQKEHPFKIIAVTPVDPWFLTGHSQELTTLLPLKHDVGLIQSDSISTDLPATLKALDEFQKATPSLIQKITDHCKYEHVSCVLSDISSLAFPVAKALGAPGFFVGNFTWADIYRDLSPECPALVPHLTRIEEEYSLAHSAFQLPWNTPLLPFTPSKIKSIPLIAPKPSSMTRKDWESITGRPFETKRKIVLLSFGGFDLQSLPMDTLASLKNDFLFLTTRTLGSHTPENLIPLNSSIPDYLGLIKHADLVMTKPGYGILADCLVEQKPVIHTERGRFAEYPVLRKFLDEQFPSVFLSKKDFLEGNWKDALKQALQIKKKFPSQALNGAEAVVRELELLF